MKPLRVFSSMYLAGLLLPAVVSAITLSPLQQLGKELYFDKISQPPNTSCASCHGPSVGFTGPIPGINLDGAVYPGAIRERFGNRKPPAAAYATLSPIFHFDDGEGLFLGGNFWDGRATGERLGNPAAEQALGPFLNPVEQHMASREDVLRRAADSKYASLWSRVWGEPISFGTPEEIATNYDRVGLAIAAFEGSEEVNAFSSKFDRFWWAARDAGMDVRDIDTSNWRDFDGLGLRHSELEGLVLFNDESKGKCALCHVLDPAMDALGNVLPPLFTDYSFDNLGTPRNPRNPFYDMDEVYLDDGSPINPLGEAWVDPGLGGFLAGHADPEWRAMAAGNMGKHKVPTLRNVDRRPGFGFPKAYMHNGVFTSLKEVLHFYNTRDVISWPPPEVPENVNDEELGDLGLTDAEENAIVAFLSTLSDGYRPSPADKSMITSVPDARAELSLDRNPFRGTAVVSFSVPTAQRVQVDVFDVAGRHVRSLVDGTFGVGRHEVGFRADGLSAGVYFVRVRTGERAVTIRTVLLK